MTETSNRLDYRIRVSLEWILLWFNKKVARGGVAACRALKL
jgi:hypothetical protein